jgi:hypothetical protein
MKKETFEELLESVREDGAILRGKQAPSREHFFELADCLASTHDPEEQSRLKEELARMTFSE